MGAPETIAPLYLEPRSAHERERHVVSIQMFRRLYMLSQAAMDCGACWLTTMGSFSVYHSLIRHTPGQSIRETVALSAISALTLVIIRKGDRIYGSAGSLLQIRETERAIRISAQLVLILLAISCIFGLPIASPALLIVLFSMPIVLALEAHLLNTVVKELHLKGYGVEKVAVYGAGETGRRVVSTLLNSPSLGMHPVVVIDENPRLHGTYVSELGYRRPRVVPVCAGPLSANDLVSSGCQVLLVPTTTLTSDQIAKVALAAEQAGIRIAYLAGGFDRGQDWTKSMDMDGLLLTSATFPDDSWFYAFAKRIFDIAVASLLLLLLAPILIAISIWIRWDSPGPALFVQTRVGKHGRTFNMFKFRSMYIDAPQYHVSPTDSADRRITNAGRFLRKVSLDEIPQLLNVILGHMSLVGPRPEMPFIVKLYNARHRQRLQVVPGLTGLWQLSADRRFQIHENLEYDLYYIRNRNFVMDLAILVHTAFFAMNGI